MKFRYKLPTPIVVLAVFLAVLQLPTAFYCVAKICGWFQLPTGNLAVDIAGIIASAIVLTATIGILTIKYSVKDGFLRLKLLGFDLFRHKAEVKNVLNAVRMKESRRLFFSYISDSPDPIIAEVVIDPKNFEQFVNALKSVNPNVIYMEEDK